jgi:hypothetical membrane protein
MQMSYENTTAPSLGRNWNRFIKWSGLCGVVGPILFVVMFTAAGFLRPGYSPVHQAISDLGVGPMPWLLNVPLVLLGSLLVVMAIGFSLAMRPIMSQPWRQTCGVLLAGPGLGYATAGIFPETNPIHWMLGMPLLAIGSVVGFLLVGLQVRPIPAWRRHGIYSMLTSASLVVLIILMNLAFMPTSPLGAFRLGGLAERIVFVDLLAWYVVTGWRLFLTGNGN